MSKASRNSKVGDRVTVTDPKTRKPATGTVEWVSPTKGTLQIALDGGGYAYEYPEDNGTVSVKVTKTYVPSKPVSEESEGSAA